jgi:hypothetical protein
VFACLHSARLFGYIGDVLFPSMVLGQFVSLADSGAILPTTASAENQFAAVSDIVRNSFEESDRGQTFVLCCAFITSSAVATYIRGSRDGPTGRGESKDQGLIQV